MLSWPFLKRALSNQRQQHGATHRALRPLQVLHTTPPLQRRDLSPIIHIRVLANQRLLHTTSQKFQTSAYYQSGPHPHRGSNGLATRRPPHTAPQPIPGTDLHSQHCPALAWIYGFTFSLHTHNSSSRHTGSSHGATDQRSSHHIPPHPPVECWIHASVALPERSLLLKQKPHPKPSALIPYQKHRRLIE